MNVSLISHLAFYVAACCLPIELFPVHTWASGRLMDVFRCDLCATFRVGRLNLGKNFELRVYWAIVRNTVNKRL